MGCVGNSLNSPSLFTALALATNLVKAVRENKKNCKTLERGFVKHRLNYLSITDPCPLFAYLFL